MPAAGRSEIASLKEAYALIGLNGPVEGPALTAAFRLNGIFVWAGYAIR